MQHDLSHAIWHKATASGNSGNCVEVAQNLPGIIAVRDSKDPAGPALVFKAREWAAFTGGVRAGDFG